MKKVYLLLIPAFLQFTGCTLKQEMKSIFNGQDLEGWEIVTTREDSRKEYWFVEDSSIVANSMGDSTHDYIWLKYAEEELIDFHLEFEFQAYRGNPGNTGIQVRSRYDTSEEWLNGPQVDIHPPRAWRTGMMWDETRGNQRWIFPDLPDGEWVDPSQALNQPPFYYADDSICWNSMEIEVEDLEVRAWLNGEKITDFNGAGILDDENHMNKQVGTSGYLFLQIHTGDQLKIRFRNLYLEKF